MSGQPQRLNIRFHVTWQAAHWHVGSGEGTAMIDRRMRTRACGGRGEYLPFVPGSQIKGVLRNRCERLVAALGGSVLSPHIVGRDPDGDVLRHFQPASHSKLLIDRLFGSRYQGDCLFVDDAIPESDHRESRPVYQSRTSIDRLTGTARDETLFVTEVAEAHGTRLHARIQARHPAGVLTQDGGDFPFEYALLLAGLLSLDALGGDKSVGLGRCQIQIPENTVHWNTEKTYPVAKALSGFASLGEDWYPWLDDLRKDTTA